jgi:hypothetical protein
MPIQEIPPDQWQEFFESYSRRHEGWLVTLEIFNHGNPQRISARSLSLKSITAEMAATPMIVIVTEDETTGISQLIRHPTRVVLKQNDVGADVGIEIETGNMLYIMRFRSAVLSELVDGVA